MCPEGVGGIGGVGDRSSERGADAKKRLGANDDWPIQAIRVTRVDPQRPGEGAESRQFIGSRARESQALGVCLRVVDPAEGRRTRIIGRGPRCWRRFATRIARRADPPASVNFVPAAMYQGAEASIVLTFPILFRA